jgi:hypothetical protein
MYDVEPDRGLAYQMDGNQVDVGWSRGIKSAVPHAIPAF